jgi:TolA-binding protein
MKNIFFVGFLIISLLSEIKMRELYASATGPHWAPGTGSERIHSAHFAYGNGDNTVYHNKSGPPSNLNLHLSVKTAISDLEKRIADLSERTQNTTLISRVSALEQAASRITTLEKELAASKAREQALDARLKESISTMERMEKRMEELENRHRSISSGPARRSRSMERK